RERTASRSARHLLSEERLHDSRARLDDRDPRSVRRCRLPSGCCRWLSRSGHGFGRTGDRSTASDLEDVTMSLERPIDVDALFAQLEDGQFHEVRSALGQLWIDGSEPDSRVTDWIELCEQSGLPSLGL